MGVGQILSILLIGALAGWLASVFVKVRGLGLFGYTVVGIIGAAVGSWVLGQVGLSLGSGFWYQVLNAFIGAVLVLTLVSLLKR
ncbi:MAG TPA: GlsB/YeaQ/YmgE family stress response membrane protein [Arenimonas sp.]|nr:GlsB/YeaQ/YmgE family stress response membrane protein [Arenimonas sp.]